MGCLRFLKEKIWRQIVGLQPAEARDSWNAAAARRLHMPKILNRNVSIVFDTASHGRSRETTMRIGRKEGRYSAVFHQGGAVAGRCVFRRSGKTLLLLAIISDRVRSPFVDRRIFLMMNYLVGLSIETVPDVVSRVVCILNGKHKRGCSGLVCVTPRRSRHDFSVRITASCRYFAVFRHGEQLAVWSLGDEK